MRKKLVIKLGGSILENTEKLSLISDKILSLTEKYQIVIVVSAFKGVTDKLIDIFTIGKDGKYKKAYNLLEKLIEHHHSLLSDKKIDREFTDLEKLLFAVSYTKELTPKSYAKAISSGERLSSIIISEFLKKLAKDKGYNLSITRTDPHIVTDSNFLDANIDFQESKKKIKFTSDISIVAGFYGVNRDGFITLLGRGGSDYSATALANIWKADEVWLIKDVDGIMTCDPSLIKDAKLIDTLSYQEASELSFFGSKVLHPRCLIPARNSNIPVIIKSINTFENGGTKITHTGNNRKKTVRALTKIDNCALISVESEELAGKPELLAKIFHILQEGNINIIMISQASSACNLTLLIPDKDAKPFTQALENYIKKHNIDSRIIVDKNIALIAAVGEKMKHTPGIAGKIFSAMGKHNINIIAIAQGSSEHNISYIIEKKDMKKALSILHQEFCL